MRTRQLVKGRVVDWHPKKISQELIGEIANSINIFDMTKVWDGDEETARKMVGEPEVLGPNTDGYFYVMGYFPTDEKETLRRLEAAFLDQCPNMIELISSTTLGRDVDLKPVVDYGL